LGYFLLYLSDMRTWMRKRVSELDEKMQIRLLETDYFIQQHMVASDS
jgi:hypothetical protein